MTLLDYPKDIFSRPERYAKFWVALGTAVVSLLSTYFADAAWLPIAIQFMGAIGVFTIKNETRSL